MWEVNGNYWSKDKYSYDEAVELSKTMVNCDNCLDCSDCVDCKKCVDCNSCDNCENCDGCIDCKYCEVYTDCVNVDGRDDE